MKLPRRAVHLDFHTMPAVPDVGADFDADAFARTLEDARVDFITVFAKCNLGMAYYPTKVGVTHPSLKIDLLGEMVEACHKRDITIAAYWNAGLDHEMALRHRDWAILGNDGRTYDEDHLDHFFRTMCFGGPWADLLAATIEEVLEGYEIDGIFLDCWYFGVGCQGVECAAGMREEGMDPTDATQRIAFQNERKMAFVRRVREMIDRIRPEATYFLNGVPYDMQLSVASHLDIESLPAGGWGFENFPWKVRYLRRRIGRGGRAIHLVGQTGRFHRSWGDFGGLRTQAGLDYDCYQAASHAVTTGIGDHMHPRGILSAEAYRRIGSIYRKLEALDDWTVDAQALTDTAVVATFNEPISVSLTEDHRQVIGATRALAELKRQFDILSADGDWSGYRTLVLADGVRLDEDRLQKIRVHLAAGGTVLSTGVGGMLAGEDAFPEEWGIDYAGKEPCKPHFLRAAPGFCATMPDEVLTVGVGTPTIAVKPVEGTETLADVIQPYFSRHWDGMHGHVYIPPDKPAGRPGITRRGSIVHFASAVFTDYAANANPLHRELVGAALAALAGDGLVRAEGLPSFARLTLTRQKDRTMVHVLCYVPELRTREFTHGAVPGQVVELADVHQAESLEMIEEPITLRDVTITLARESVSHVYLAPSKTEIDFTADGPRVTFTVPEITGYQMIVVQ